jgi:16S rRNA (cytosine967-C5)-methyltransferase
MPAKPPADRAAALRALEDLEERNLSLDLALARLDGSKLEPRRRRFARQLLFSCLRWQGRLDWIASRYSRRPLDQLDPAARRLLRLGLCQLFFMEGVPPHAGVHATVELAKTQVHRGIVGLVNAMLRQAWRERVHLRYPDPSADIATYLSIIHSHPIWLVNRWLERWGQSQTTALLQANNRSAPIYLRSNTVLPASEQLATKLEADGFEPVAQKGYPGFYRLERGDGLFSTAAFNEGLFHVQDLSASLAVRLLEPTAGETILDTCSAPGGKTAQIAAAVGPDGRVVAADTSPRRLRRLLENAARMHLDRIVAVAAVDCQGIETRFDRVLVDAPCTGTGTLGRRPDARWRKAADQLDHLVAIQRRLLEQAFARLRPGGVMVYSTCSLEPEENEAVVEAFLADHSDATLEPAHDFFTAAPWVSRFINTLPGRDAGDGGFAARLRRLS